MNELLRLDYLSAMGITQYVARAPLPGARPSDILTIIVPSALQQPQSIASLLEDDVLPIKTPTTQASPATENTSQQPAQQEVATTVFQCQIAMWIVNDLLVLADAPRLDNTQLALLRNILHAIGRTQELSAVKQFTWPLSQRREKSLHAAREHFQGMLDGGLLKTDGLRQILCFGNAAEALLRITDENPDQLTQYQDWPVIRVCPLQEMLDQPRKKAATWQTLQILVRT